MRTISRSHVISAGLAMFCMFFGAGNVVYPLALGQFAQDKNIFALIGMLITAVGVPFLGVIAMILFDGDHRAFFGRLGTIPSFLTTAVIMCLLGPFGAIPRCIALSYSTVSEHISLPLFSLLTCLFIFAFTIKQNRILDILGYVFTPFLLLALGVIIAKGLLFADEAPISPHDNKTAFLLGLKQGYQTMDLLGAFFFSSLVLVGLKAALPEAQEDEASEEEITAMQPTTMQSETPPSLDARILRASLHASWIGAVLLSLIYIGFSYVAALHSKHLDEVLPHDLINQISYLVLGSHGGIIVAIAVSLACVTTAMALASVFADYLHTDLSDNRLSYGTCLAITLILSGFISTLNFNRIIAMLAPVLEICYPALIMLCIVNILYKLYQFKPVKIPVFAIFALSLLNELF